MFFGFVVSESDFDLSGRTRAQEESAGLAACVLTALGLASPAAMEALAAARRPGRFEEFSLGCGTTVIFDGRHFLGSSPFSTAITRLRQAHTMKPRLLVYLGSSRVSTLRGALCAFSARTATRRCRKWLAVSRGQAPLSSLSLQRTLWHCQRQT